MPCPFCNEIKNSSTSYPTNIYNGKPFIYVRCAKCKLAYLNNFPTDQDYIKMYPPSYQGGAVDSSIQKNPYEKLQGLRYSYGYQFDLIKELLHQQSIHILDYGCGNGHFLANAVHHGFACDGSEFSEEYLKILRSNFQTSNFYSISEVLSETFSQRYDVIRLSNVLEHLTSPVDVIKKLQKHLKPGGILLVEGPIEENFSVATGFRKCYFWFYRLIKPKRTVSDHPYHIFLSNRKNQRTFFNICGLEELHFATSEDPWPFPVSFKSAKGVQEKIMAFVAKVSRIATKTIGKNWGNIFIYAGKSKEE